MVALPELMMDMDASQGPVAQPVDLPHDRDAATAFNGVFNGQRATLTPAAKADNAGATARPAGTEKPSAAGQPRHDELVLAAPGSVPAGEKPLTAQPGVEDGSHDFGVSIQTMPSAETATPGNSPNTPDGRPAHGAETRSIPADAKEALAAIPKTGAATVSAPTAPTASDATTIARHPSAAMPSPELSAMGTPITLPADQAGSIKPSTADGAVEMPSSIMAAKAPQPASISLARIRHDALAPLPSLATVDLKGHPAPAHGQPGDIAIARADRLGAIAMTPANASTATTPGAIAPAAPATEQLPAFTADGVEPKMTIARSNAQMAPSAAPTAAPVASQAAGLGKIELTVHTAAANGPAPSMAQAAAQAAPFNTMTSVPSPDSTQTVSIAAGSMPAPDAGESAPSAITAAMTGPMAGEDGVVATTSALAALPQGAAPGQVMTAGAAPTAAASLAADPAVQQQALSQITSALEASQAGPRRMELRLDPPELGRVAIDFRFDGDHRVTAVLTADQPETASMMRRSLDILMRDLAAAGFTDVSLSMGNSGGQEKSAGFDQRQPGQATRGHAAMPGQDEAAPGRDSPALYFHDTDFVDIRL